MNPWLCLVVLGFSPSSLLTVSQALLWNISLVNCLSCISGPRVHFEIRLQLTPVSALAHVASINYPSSWFCSLHLWSWWRLLNKMLWVDSGSVSDMCWPRTGSQCRDCQIFTKKLGAIPGLGSAVLSAVIFSGLMMTYSLWKWLLSVPVFGCWLLPSSVKLAGWGLRWGACNSSSRQFFCQRTVLDIFVCLNHEPIQNFFFPNMGRTSKFCLYYVSQFKTYHHHLSKQQQWWISIEL